MWVILVAFVRMCFIHTVVGWTSEVNMFCMLDMIARDSLAWFPVTMHAGFLVFSCVSRLLDFRCKILAVDRCLDLN